MNRWSRWLASVFALLLFVFSGIAHAYDVPTHEGAVTDTSGTLTTEDDAALEARIAAYRTRTGNEIGVLVIASLDGETIEDVAYRTFNAWGVGGRGADNGVLLVIAMREHRSRIETGKGIGHLLTDVQSAHILQETLAPRLRRHQYREGIAATLDAIETALGSEGGAPPRPAARRESQGGGLVVFIALGLGLILFVALFACLRDAAAGTAGPAGPRARTTAEVTARAAAGPAGPRARTTAEVTARVVAATRATRAEEGTSAAAPRAAAARAATGNRRM
jgi:uncharacterized protein